MGWFDDVVDFVGDVADVVSDPIGTIADVVSDPVGAITDAVESVSNVVEGVAPLGGMIGTVLGGPIGGAIGGAAGQLLGGGDGGGGGPFGFVTNIIDTVSDVVPDGLMDVATNLIGGGSLIGAAGDLLGGGLGDVASSVLGTAGDLVPGLGGGSVLDFVTDCFPDPLDAGGDVLGKVLGGGLGLPTEILDTVGDTIGDVVGTAQEAVQGTIGTLTDAADGIAGQAQDTALGFLDDILPDVAGGFDSSTNILEGLGQIAQTGGLGAALAQLSSDDLSALVTKLVTPVSAAAAGASDEVAQATSGPSGMDDDFTFEVTPTNTGIVPPDLLGDDDLLGTGAAAAADDGSMVTMDSGDLAGTSGPADMDSSGGFSDDVFATDVPMDAPAPDVAPAPEPEPEPSDFSQAIQSADAVDQSFDSMFEGLE